MSSEKFERWRQALSKELLRAHTHFSIWEQLWPTEETLSILGRFPVFYNMTRQAHLEQSLLHIRKVTEKRKDSINLGRLLDLVRRFPHLAPGLSAKQVGDLEKRLQSHAETIRRIRLLVDKVIAYYDELALWPDKLVGDANTVRLAEVKALLQSLEDVFNKLSAAHDKQIWGFEPPRIDDTTLLVQELARARNRKQLS